MFFRRMQSTSGERRVHGWLVVDKPRGISSYKVVATIKHLFKIRKAGHAGTLDLEASGLLAVALGEATKTISFQTDSTKEYTFKVVWGAQTDTDDSSGLKIHVNKKVPKEIEILKVLELFKGNLEQIPPIYSAKKINGERAYKLARKKIDVNLSEKKIHVFKLDLIEYKKNIAEFFIRCSKGTYVRAMARDMGKALGCFGHADDIRRISSGVLNLKDAIKFEKIKELSSYDLSKSIIPTRKILEHLIEIKCSENQYFRLTHGSPIKIANTLEYDDAWASYLDVPIALGKTESGFFTPRKVLKIV